MMMLVFRRMAAALALLLIVTTITFAISHAAGGTLLPGFSSDVNLTPAQSAQIRAGLGLDRPLYVQYLNWLGVAYVLKLLGLAVLVGGPQNVDPGLLQADFGRSLLTGRPVLQEILPALSATLLLSTAGMVLGVVLSIPLGVLAALRRGRPVDHLLTLFSVVGFAIPQFWLGLVLILIFAVGLNSVGLPHLPFGGLISPLGGGDPLDRLAHLALPAIVLAASHIAVWTRYVRSSMLEVLSEDYVRTARAKGMTDRRVVFVHALRNAITPLITIAGLELPRLVSGALVLEVVFQWPGIGLLTYRSATSFDYSTVLGTTTFVAAIVVAGNLVADLLYSVADPRIRVG
jgi:peptide/nickel transport system permease protein